MKDNTKVTDQISFILNGKPLPLNPPCKEIDNQDANDVSPYQEEKPEKESPP